LPYDCYTKNTFLPSNMSKFSIYVQEGEQAEVFLQSSSDVYNLKKDKSTIDRWLYEMGVELVDHASVKFTIYQADGSPLFVRSLVGSGSKSWVKAAA